MPYIQKELRKPVDPAIEELASKLSPYACRDGMLNYAITRLLNLLYPTDKYSEFNEALGVLDAAAREFYRRRVAPYEDKKIKENGDVYEGGT